MRRSRPFLDTNVLLYVFDPEETEKRQKAIALLKELGSSFFVSTQVLQEFYVVATRKKLLGESHAKEFLADFDKNRVVSSNFEFVLEAVDIARTTGFTLWDSLIIQAAITAKCDRLLTEDMQHGQVVRGVRIENPFL